MELLRFLKKQLTKLQLMISKLNLKLKALKLLLNNFIIYRRKSAEEPWGIYTMALLYYRKMFLLEQNAGQQ